MILTSLSPQLFLYQEKPPFYVGGLYYESMTRMSSRQTHLLKGENLLLIIELTHSNECGLFLI